MATATSMDYVQKIFIAYLGRGASTEALTTWGDAIDADQEAGKGALFYSLWTSAEGKALYDGKTVEDIITTIFNNAFERDPLQAGIDAWEAEVVSGRVNTVELAGAIVNSADAAGAATYGFKNQAADYYRTESDAAGRAFNPVESKAAVDPVDGPNSLVNSKAETDAVISGAGSTLALTVGNDTLTMTGGDDVVTGTDLTMGNAGTNIDSIVDSSTTDSDILSLTGTNDTVTFGTVSGIETVNLSLEKQLGTTFRIDADGLVGGDLNITTATTTLVAGLTVLGSTTVVANDVSSDVITTGVTDLTVLRATDSASALTIQGDASLVALTVDETNDVGVSIIMANDSATQSIALSGNDGTNDAVSISANNAVAVNTNREASANDIDLLTLSGNTNDVTYTISGASSDLDLTVTGDKDVTVSIKAAEITGNKLTDTGAGTSTLAITNIGANVDLTGASADVVSVGNVATNTISFNDSQDVTITDTQLGVGGAKFSQFNGNDGTLEITLDAGLATSLIVGDIETLGFDELKINAGNLTVTGLDVDTSLGANDASVTIVGTNDITTDVITAGDGAVTVSGKALNLGAVSGAGGIDIDSTNDVTITSAVSARGVDIKATANIVSASDINGGTGAGNDVSLQGATLTISNAAPATNDIAGDDITIDMSNDTAASVIAGNITAGNDVSISGGNIDLNQALGAKGNLVAGMNITVSDTASLAVAGDMTSTAGGITITGTSDVTVAGTTTATVGGVTIVSTNDVDLNNFVGSVLNAGSATGKITVSDTSSAVPITLVTGSGNDSLTLADAQAHNVSSGGGVDTIIISTVGAASVINAEGGEDIITVTDATTTGTISGGDDNDSITVTTVHLSALDGGNGYDTLNLDNQSHIAGGSFVNFEKVTINTDNATEISAAQFANENTFELSGGGFTLTIDADTADVAATVDASNVTGDIGAVANLDIDGSSNDDTLTGSELVDVIDGNAGNDVISGGEGLDVLSGGPGFDTIVGGAGADTIVGGTQNDTLTGSGGTDTFVYLANISGAADDGIDTYLDFTATSDKLDVNGFVNTSGVALETAAVNTSAPLALNTNTAGIEQVFGVTLSATDALDTTEVIAAISNGTVTINAGTDTALLSVVTTTGDTYLYTVNSADTAVTAAEIVLIGIFDLTATGFANGDFI